MPKTAGGGNQKRRKKQRPNEGAGRELQIKEDGQEYALVVKILGGDRVSGVCFDGQTRLCHIRGTMRRGAHNRVQEGDIVLVGLRDYQDSKADVIHRYSADDARNLISLGELPANTNINGAGQLGNTMVDEDDIGAYDFSSI